MSFDPIVGPMARFAQADLGVGVTGAASRSDPTMIEVHHDKTGLAKTVTAALGHGTVWVGRLPAWLCDEADLSDLMEEAGGPVESVAIRRKHLKAGFSRSWAFCTFINPMSATALINNPPMVTDVKATAETAAYDPSAWPLLVQRQSTGKHMVQNAEVRRQNLLLVGFSVVAFSGFGCC